MPTGVSASALSRAEGIKGTTGGLLAEPRGTTGNGRAPEAGGRGSEEEGIRH
jgi:hypothetical protein